MPIFEKLGFPSVILKLQMN